MISFPIYFCILVFVNLIKLQITVSSELDDLLKLDSAKDNIMYFNYPYEEYKVVTDDGYILTLHRIPYSNKSVKYIGTPVLLIHGLFGSSMSFIIGGPNKGLAFILSDANYDVWIMNCRGNSYSKHISLKENDSEFWNSSYHEIGVYDIPAVLDFILKNTTYEEIPIVAYSQGTTASFVMLSERPEYNTKVKALISYAPSVYKCRIKMMGLRMLASPERTKFWTNIRKNYGDFNVFSLGVGFIKPFVSLFCTNPIFQPVCAFNFKLLSNTMPEQIDWKSYALVLKHYPCGSSFKQVVHFFQSILNCSFQKYQNSMNEVPKPYNLKNVNVDNYVFYAAQDTLQDPEDVFLLERNLNKKFKKVTKLNNFGHGDFMHGIDAPSLIFNPTVDILNSLQ